MLGIDFGGTKIALATATLDGRLVESDRLETEAGRGAVQAVERALARADELLSAAARNGGGRCRAVSAVSPGIVYEDRVALAPNVPGWQELKLPALLRERFEPAPAAVGTDVKAAAAAELRWGSLRGADPAILLILGTGLAAADRRGRRGPARRERRGRRDRLQPPRRGRAHRRGGRPRPARGVRRRARHRRTGERAARDARDRRRGLRAPGPAGARAAGSRAGRAGGPGHEHGDRASTRSASPWAAA